MMSFLSLSLHVLQNVINVSLIRLHVLSHKLNLRLFFPDMHHQQPGGGGGNDPGRRELRRPHVPNGGAGDELARGMAGMDPFGNGEDNGLDFFSLF